MMTHERKKSPLNLGNFLRIESNFIWKYGKLYISGKIYASPNFLFPCQLKIYKMAAKYPIWPPIVKMVGTVLLKTYFQNQVS